MNSDLKNIGKLILPPVLRQPKVLAWVEVFMALLAALKSTFMGYRDNTLFILAHNSQVNYLEHYLNAKFNPSGTAADPFYEGKGIYINDAQQHEQTFIHLSQEQAPPVYITDQDYNSGTYLFKNEEAPYKIGFTVWVPDSFGIDEKEITGEIKRLVLAGKRFNIEYYTL